MNAKVYYDGIEITHKIISYSRQQQICTGVGNATFAIYITDEITPQTYKEIVLWEDGIKKATYIVTDYTYDIPGDMITFGCQDYSKRLQDYFISDQFIVTEPTTALFIIKKYLDIAGITYVIDTEGEGNLVNNQSAFGLTDAMSVIIQMLQINGWYLYFDPDSVAHVGRFEFDSDSSDLTITKDNMIIFKTTNNDSMFRNRVVVWGMGNPEEDSWVFAEVDKTGQFPNEYGPDDTRTIVVSNQDIPDNDTALIIANQAIKEFSKTNFEVSVDIIGPQDIVLGDHIYIDDKHLQFLGTVTTVGSELSGGGHITHVVLNQRCPRLFSYYDFGGYVYVGTQSAGVLRKHLRYDHIWRDYSDGLSSSGVTDLYITNGKLACTTDDGKLWQRNVMYSGWEQVTMSGMTRFGHPISDAEIDFIGVTINNVDSTIYAIGNLKGSLLGGENCYLLTKKGQIGTLENVNYLDDFVVTGVDIDTDNKNPILSVLVGGITYIDHNIVRNTYRDFEHLEDNRLVDLKDGILRYRGDYQRSHPGWTDGQLQGEMTTFWGDYSYQFHKTYFGTPQFDHYFTGIFRMNMRLAYPDNINDPLYKSLQYWESGFGLGQNNEALALIDFDRVVAAGNNDRGIDFFNWFPSEMTQGDFSTGVIQTFPPTINFDVDLLGGGFYALPNGYVIGIGRSNSVKLVGLMYDANYANNTGKVLSDEDLGDTIVDVPQTWGSPHETNAVPVSAINVNGITYGVFVSGEIKNNSSFPDGYSYHLYGFAYGVDIAGGMGTVVRNKEATQYNEEIRSGTPWTSNGKPSLGDLGTVAIGVDFIGRTLYFVGELGSWSTGSMGYRLFAMSLDSLSISEAGTTIPDGSFGNDKRFYFYIDNKVYRTTDLEHEICTLPVGAIIAKNLDNYTNEGIFTIWKTLPNPDNVAHYEVYAFDPEFGTYRLLDKLNTNGFIDYNGTENGGNRGYDFRGDRLISGGDSKWVLFPEVTSDFEISAYIPMTLIASSGVVNSGTWNTRTFDYSTAMTEPAKIEISDYSPYVLYGKSPITYGNSILYSGYTTTNSGILYISDSADVGSWLYDIPGVTTSGDIIDSRSFGRLTPSGISVITLFTQRQIGSGFTNLYFTEKNDEGLYHTDVYTTMSGQLEMVETTNRADQPYIFVSTSGDRYRFYQKDAMTGIRFSGMFNQYITDLPDSKINVIRTDNRI